MNEGCWIAVIVLCIALLASIFIIGWNAEEKRDAKCRYLQSLGVVDTTLTVKQIRYTYNKAWLAEKYDSCAAAHDSLLDASKPVKVYP